MNPKPIINWLGLVGTTAALTLGTVSAKPDKGEKNGHSSDKSEKNSEKKSEKQDNKDHSKNEKADRKDDKQDRKEDHHPQAQEPRRVYKKGEFKEHFQDRDRDRVVSYFSGYKGHDHGLPPGLAKNWQKGKRLPAGWRDRVVSGYVIESEWLPAFHPVEYSWFPGIAVVPDTRLYWYGDRVVRVYEPTREVVDVIIVPTIHIDF